jgi:hypothetical protein
MRSLKIFVLIVMCAGLVLGTAASAYAYTGSQGTVYGQATMQPTVSIQLTGTGTDLGNPLVYQGHAGDTVWSTGYAQVMVTNNGDVGTPILLGYGSDPTDGSNTWPFADSASATDSKWEFTAGSWVTVPGSGVGPRQLIGSLAPGDLAGVVNRFTFPTTFNGNVHSMQALFIAGGEG